MKPLTRVNFMGFKMYAVIKDGANFLYVKVGEYNLHNNSRYFVSKPESLPSVFHMYML